ncbi:MAG: hypothetical protein AB2669_07160 [Candidatus Thiodiazotropha endolucinida]|nr:hypothetical protein [Candidatus Thiodiazotropha taylori]MCG8092686.1 hypothetical protein [Candidatus Thiodiazotropha endolucinida]MCG7883122.1 hypothetical protein [Candidatus Thiodiazotropha taylori]MCG7887023.1 hypothetical protein [Candidatus Thiodiazotropha taylori]MCG7892604.1 hypothetical protein [Candidatus Thiodiazotropha taylori]
MALSEEFVLRVSEISHSKKMLVDLMNQLDEEKRSIRSFQRQWSNDTKNNGGLHGPERYRKLRKLKDRISFLIEEREYVRQKLGELNGDQKSLSRAAHKNIEFVHAFMAAAERILSEDTFIDLEAKASEIMMQEV